MLNKKKGNKMRTLHHLVLVLIFVVIAFTSCKGQPKSEYEIYGDTVTSANKYLFFIEKKSAQPYKLQENMDYLSPVNVSYLKIGESSTPIFTVLLDNDGSEYKVGIVAETISGFYSGMGTAIGNVGISPTKPGGVGLRKK